MAVVSRRRARPTQGVIHTYHIVLLVILGVLIGFNITLRVFGQDDDTPSAVIPDPHPGLRPPQTDDVTEAALKRIAQGGLPPEPAPLMRPSEPLLQEKPPVTPPRSPVTQVEPPAAKPAAPAPPSPAPAAKPFVIPSPAPAQPVANTAPTASLAQLQKNPRPLCHAAPPAPFLPMLINIINTSIRQFHLNNFLVVGLDDGVCPGLPPDVTCFRYPATFASGNFGSTAFAKLVNIKTEILMAIVQLGYNGLLVDGDIVFLRDPFTTLHAASSFDLQIQDDAEGGRNSGFMYVRRTPPGLLFLGKALDIANHRPGMRQQPAVNDALKALASNRVFSHSVLSTAAYPCGKAYFEKPRRMFAYDHPCTTCEIMHNNWIVGSDAKVYRFKEHLKWMVDAEQYYSSPTRKYLEVGNPYGAATLDQEVAALKAAFKLGQATGRVVILPDFRCHGCKVDGAGGTVAGCSGASGDRDSCAFIAHLKIATFNKHFKGAYREHMFRYNPLVPAGIRLDMAGEPEAARGNGGGDVPTFVLNADHKHYGPGNTIVVGAGAGGRHDAAVVAKTVEGIAVDAQVVRFAALYNVNVVLAGSSDSAFEAKWRGAVKRGTLRQY